MVPSTFRLAALALRAAAAALFAFPALRQGVATERADAHPATEPQHAAAAGSAQPELQPVRLLARQATPADTAEGARAPKKKSPTYRVARIRADHAIKLRAKPGGSP